MPQSMAHPVEIRRLGEFVDQEVILRGWLYGKRMGGKLIFLLLRDGTGICQCPVEEKEADAFSVAEKLTPESSISLRGRVRRDERAPGSYEVTAVDIQVTQLAQDYPITRKAHGVDFLLSHRHLWLRSPRQATILRIRHTIISAARRFFDERGFTLIDTPILAPGAAEGAGTLFPVDYFGQPVFLAQTGQLYLESACLALGKVYCFGPTFRAEKSKTRRHLAEFWMIEPEIAFAQLPDLLVCAEAMTCYLVAAVLEKHRADLQFLERDPAPLEKITPPFPRLTYSQAVELLRSPDLQEKLKAGLEKDRANLAARITELGRQEEEFRQARKGWKQDKLEAQIQEDRERIRDLETELENQPAHLEQAANFSWGKDLGGAEETILSQQFEKPVFITEYPREVKAFYMKRSPTRPEVVLNLDMLAPEGYGEIIGGSQREDDLETLEQRMAEEGMNPAPYQWYLDLRRFGSVPHGGFGLGIERTVAWICGLKHIRESIPFPRLMGRIYP